MKKRTLEVIFATAALLGHVSAARKVRGAVGLTRFAGEDVADGGVGDVTPICDPTEDCSDEDEEVQEELIVALEKDSQITVVRDVELGELLCDSLKGASEASLLRFAISSNETVVAERTSYTVVSGDVFTNDQDRKVWMGVVVDPEPLEGDFPRTVSMTWADECDVETFLLKVVHRNPDGTTSIVMSVPCSAGSSMDICLVEVEVEFEEEREPRLADDATDQTSLRRLLPTGLAAEGQEETADETPDRHTKAEDIRLLNKYLSATDEEREAFHARGLQRLDGDMVAMPSGRRLTCSTQVDTLVLYSAAAMGALGDITTDQMESIITAAFVTTNDALDSSDIELTIELVHVAQLPYTQERFTTTALNSLETNAEVAELRETYHADVVQMFGSFGPCGYAELYTGFDTSAFSVVTATCLDNFSHTHELGHNFGCYHNREGTNHIQEYAHGYRYCTGVDSYRTVMSYECEDDDTVPRVNYFSNPDVSYLDKPTGTSTEDNARAVRESMLTVANYRSSEGCDVTGSTCSSAGDCCVGTCSNAGLCEAIGCNGDPHLVGFSGQKFDFTGEDGLWYALVSDGPCHQTNIRITAPVPEAPEITYITGVALSLCDVESNSHTIEITVKEPHSLDSSFPEQEQGLRLADGALRVVLDGEEMTRPGQVDLGGSLTFAAANLPGACRSFGFEKYWLSKEEDAKQGDAAGRRRLQEQNPVKAVPMPVWITSDPHKTNADECREYAARGEAQSALFTHQSEHTSMQIASPHLSLRISHGKVHQLPMRDPTDRYDLPDHTAFQMNLVFEDVRLGPDPQGLVGETITPVLDAEGTPVMQGLDAIRGAESDYLLSGPFGQDFAQLRAANVGSEGTAARE